MVWLMENYAQCVDEDDRIVLDQLDEDIIQEYMTHAALKKDGDGEYLMPFQFSAVTTVGSVASSIKMLYTTEKKDLPGEIETAFATFLAGYKRKVQELKTSGELPQQEGKSPMSREGCFLIDMLLVYILVGKEMP
jgi:hypothetical protein